MSALVHLFLLLLLSLLSVLPSTVRSLTIDNVDSNITSIANTSNNDTSSTHISTSSSIKHHHPIKYAANLTVFISITSGKHHVHLRQSARSTWLLPCLESISCDYRFFVDCPVSRMTERIEEEQKLYQDMVFRNSCALMSLHPDDIHYGNSPPPNHKDENETVLSIYHNRIFYKIDWKVCFMRWIMENDKNALYHVFVEDDSFICTENLIYQTKKLASLPEHKRMPFRTGTAMYDGFDDSSTFMSREVLVAFAKHYLEPGFNCSHVRDAPIDSEIRSNAQWLSWGNSWISSQCNWRDVLNRSIGLNIHVPSMQCLSVISRTDLHTKFGITLDTSASVSSWPPQFPCQEHNIIFHHGKAGEILLNRSDDRVRHVCEYLLLIDKVKSPTVTHALWNATKGKHFRDFSPVFMSDGLVGWDEMFMDYGITQHCLNSRMEGKNNPNHFSLVNWTVVATKTLVNCSEWIAQRSLRTLDRPNRYLRASNVNIRDRSSDLGVSDHINYSSSQGRAQDWSQQMVVKSRHRLKYDSIDVEHDLLDQFFFGLLRELSYIT